MVIARGVDWGSPGDLPVGTPVADSNEALLGFVQSGQRLVGLTGGDLCRTLGGAGTLSLRLPIDIGHVRLDSGEESVFLAHCLAYKSLWHGPVVAAMNAQFIGDWDVAPRSHPNDGILDTFEAMLGFRERIQARRRLRLGTHVPHPAILQGRTVGPVTIVTKGQRSVWVDGVPIGKTQSITVWCEADALTVVL